MAYKNIKTGEIISDDQFNALPGTASILHKAPEPVQNPLSGGILDKASTLFQNTGKFLGGAALNVANLFTSKSKDVKGLNSSNQNLNDIDQKAIQQARILAQQGQKDKADKLLEVVRSHGSNVTLNDILPDSQQNTVKEIAGAGLGAATEVGSFAEGLGGVESLGGAKTVGQGIMRGIETGGKIGGLSGIALGTSSALQKNKGIGDVANEALKGGVQGSIAGSVLGGLGGGIAGAQSVKAQKELTKVSREAYDVVAPELSKSEKIAALETGRGTMGPKGEIIINPTKRDLQVAKTVEGIVNPKKTSVENIMAIRNEIKTEAEATIAGLKNNNAIFNKTQLAAHLETIEKPPLLASDEKLNNAYELAKQKFIDFTDNHKKNLSGLLEARKEFDAWAQKAFPKIFDDVNQAPLQSALKDMRSAANDFIAAHLPEGNPFRASLQKQNLLYEAVDNIASKSYKEVGTNSLQRFAKKFPKITKTLKYGAIGAAGAIGGSTIKNAVGNLSE